MSGTSCLCENLRYSSVPKVTHRFHTYKADVHNVVDAQCSEGAAQCSEGAAQCSEGELSICQLMSCVVGLASLKFWQRLL